MAALISIPTALINDKNIKDFDIRVYMVIAQYVNETGYTKIKNETLAYKLGKGERSIQMALDNLINRHWIKRKQNVKKSNLYDQDYSRVLWLDEFYRKHDHRTHKAKEKTIRNDFNKFVTWLKTDCKGIKFPVQIGGLIKNYSLIQTDNKTVLHVYDEYGEWKVLDKYDSKDVYLRLFKNKSVIIERLLKEY